MNPRRREEFSTVIRPRVRPWALRLRPLHHITAQSSHPPPSRPAFVRRGSSGEQNIYAGGKQKTNTHFRSLRMATAPGLLYSRFAICDLRFVICDSDQGMQSKPSAAMAATDA